MTPLQHVVGDARVVALGEATHGTREFFQLKHRMIEFLATRMGFTIFTIEANMPEAYKLNDYVLGGAGDPKQLLRGMNPWPTTSSGSRTRIQEPKSSFGLTTDTLRTAARPAIGRWAATCERCSVLTTLTRLCLQPGFVSSGGHRTSKGLHNFSLGPAPEDSLDAKLASAGLPILALDLRTPPKDAPAASWLKAAHPTRSIGAVFSVKQAANCFVDAPAAEMFDVLLFVADTTAARKLAPGESQ